MRLRGKHIFHLPLTTAGLVLWTLSSLPVHAQPHAVITKEIFDQWMKELSNWDRWGKDDEMGAINLITSAK
jgi:hypothetical protein